MTLTAESFHDRVADVPRRGANHPERGRNLSRRCNVSNPTSSDLFVQCACGCGEWRSSRDRRGRPRRYLDNHEGRRPPMPDETYFWLHVDRSGGPDACWPWTGQKRPNGYGACSLGAIGQKRLHYAHRLAYTFNYGPFQSDLLVCHHCDNRPCCNPGHLFLGTNRDNALDAINKGRWRPNPRKGEQSPAAKLTLAEVVEIRRLHLFGTTKTELGKQFGVTRTAIHWICVGKNWRDALAEWARKRPELRAGEDSLDSASEEP